MESSQHYFISNHVCHQQLNGRHKEAVRWHKRIFFCNLTVHHHQSFIMKTRRILIHTFAWLTYITIESISILAVRLGFNVLFSLMYFPLYVGLFYFHSHFVLRVVEEKWSSGKKIVAIIIVILEIILATLICLGIRWLIGYSFLHQTLLDLNRNDIAASAWRVEFFLMMATGYWFGLKIVRVEKQNSLLKLSQLQLQLKPHLIVNTLGFVYGTILEKSKEGSDAILLLSDVMRYSFKEPEQDGKVPVADEITQVRNLIEINKIRFDKRFVLDYHISENWPDEWRIPPSLLLTLIGNVFQHGQLTNAEHPAKVNLRSIDNRLTLYTYNLKNINAAKSSQTGLKNTKTQLQAFFPEQRHRLSITESEIHYSLSLIIWL